MKYIYSRLNEKYSKNVLKLIIFDFWYLLKFYMRDMSEKDRRIEKK